MSIILHCNSCGDEISDVDPVMVELQHWLIARYKNIEEHFCRKCRPDEEQRIAEEREKIAQAQENE